MQKIISAKNVNYMVLFVFLTIYCFGASMADLQIKSQDRLIDNIKKSIPSEWRIAEIKSDVIPRGHYWGLEYKGPKGLSIVLEGPMDVFLHWKDKKGDWHQEALAKESLELWIMPHEYRESWKRFFIIHRPKSAELLFSGRIIKVYVYPAHRGVSDKKFNEILSHAKSTSWPDSPANNGVLSWKTWKKDLTNSLK